MWQLSEGTRLLARSVHALGQPRPPEAPDLELAAMPSIKYAAREGDVFGRPSLSSVDSLDSERSSATLPPRSLIDNCLRQSRMRPSSYINPLTQMLHADIALAKAQALAQANAAQTYRSRAVLSVRLLRDYDISAAHPALVRLQNFLAAAESTGAQPLYYFLSPTLTFGRSGLGVLMSQQSPSASSQSQRLEMLAYNLGCLNDAVAFAAQVHTGLTHLAATYGSADSLHTFQFAFESLQRGDEVALLCGQEPSFAPWPVQPARPALLGLCVGLATLRPELALLSSGGCVAAAYGLSAAEFERTIRSRWLELVLHDGPNDEDEGYSSAASAQRSGTWATGLSAFGAAS